MHACCECACEIVRVFIISYESVNQVCLPWHQFRPPGEYTLILSALQLAPNSPLPPPTSTNCCSRQDIPVVGHCRRDSMNRFPRTSARNCLHVIDSAQWVSRGARISIDKSRSSDSALNGEWERARKSWLFGLSFDFDVNGVNSGVLIVCCFKVGTSLTPKSANV